jgi:hypothetical protein
MNQEHREQEKQYILYKSQMICHYKRNESTCDIGHATEVQKFMPRTICNTAEEIKCSCLSATSSSAKIPTISEIMETLKKYSQLEYGVKQEDNLADLTTIKEKEKNIYDSIKSDYPSKEEEFSARNG